MLNEMAIFTQGSSWKRVQKDNERQGEWRTTRTFQDHCIYELTVIMTACAVSAQVQARQSSRLERVGKPKVSPLAEELLIYESYWKKMSQFSLRV